MSVKQRNVTQTYVASWIAAFTASSTRFWYCGIWLAARMREGLVVASVGLYWSMAARKMKYGKSMEVN